MIVTLRSNGPRFSVDPIAQSLNSFQTSTSWSPAERSETAAAVDAVARPLDLAALYPAIYSERRSAAAAAVTAAIAATKALGTVFVRATRFA